MTKYPVERGPSGFPKEAPCAIPTHFRTYGRLTPEGTKESWQQVNERTVKGISKLGKFTPEQEALLLEMQGQLYMTLAGRVLWFGGTPASEKPENIIGLYNCSSLTPTNWGYFNLLMRQLGLGTGVGFVLFPENVNKLPLIKRGYELRVTGTPGDSTPVEETQFFIKGDTLLIEIGDSLTGWANSFEGLLHTFSDTFFNWAHKFDAPLPPQVVKVEVYLGRVRKAGSPIKGFGGVTNPSYLSEFFIRVYEVLTKAIGRRLTTTEVALIQCITAKLIVAGNVRRCIDKRVSVITYNYELGLEVPLPISQVTPGTLVKTPTGYKKVLASESNGVQKVWRVNTKALSFLATANHRLGVETREGYAWKQVDELKVGDTLYHLPGEFEFIYEVTDLEPDADVIEVWDIQVEDDECFYFKAQLSFERCGDLAIGFESLKQNAILSHNSALMIQFAFNDMEGATLKDNLWQEVTPGVWKIDPHRDPLRMANVTRVALKKSPLTLGVIEEAVRKQYLSGEGAIQWGGGALIRANTDLLKTKTLKKKFIEALEKDTAQEYLISLGCSEEEALDRLQRFGLNPCVTGDTWVHTEFGPRQVKELIGVQHKTFINGELFSTTKEGFFYTGKKPVVELMTKEGYSLKLTSNHKLLKVTAQTNKNLYTEWAEVKDLQPGDKISLHDHWMSKPWSGNKGEDEFEIEEADYNSYLTFLKGIFDTKGDVEWDVKKEESKVTLINYSQLSLVQRMLLRLGINCTVSGDKLIIQRGVVSRFRSLIGFRVPEKNERLWSLPTPCLLSLDSFTAEVFSITPCGEEDVYDCTVPGPARFDANGFVAHNCGEITGLNFMCNLGQVHLDIIDPHDYKLQEKAFKASALGVASLLQKGFTDPLLQKSRELDPIVAVTFTGLFDFFVSAFGEDWLHWWDAGRPKNWGRLIEIDRTSDEKAYWNVEPPKEVMHQSEYFRVKESHYLNTWRITVEQTIKEYCEIHNLKTPSRCTSLQPAGSKSLLTGGTSAFYPPKSLHYWRAITMGRYTPEAQACYEYGYQIATAQSCKDEEGNVITDPHDPRVTEWLIRIPCRVPWADQVPPGLKVGTLEGAPIESQWDLYRTVDQEYVRHTTSITLEFSESDIPVLSKLIYEGIQDDSYVSVALLSRDYKFGPTMPFCPMDKEEYQQEMTRLQMATEGKDLESLIHKYQLELNAMQEAPPPSCGGDLCELNASK